MRLFGKAIDVRDFTTAIMQRRRTIIDPDPREMALVFGQIRVAKKITQEIGVGTENVNGLTIETKIGSKRREVEVELPETFDIEVPLFVGTDPVKLSVDLLALAHPGADENEPGQVTITATCPDLEVKIVEAFEAMLANVATIDTATVGRGRLDFASWDRV